jgi:Leucine-rich repeat (LRR) protein
MGCHLGKEGDDFAALGDSDYHNEVVDVFKSRKRGSDMSGSKLTTITSSDLPPVSERRRAKVLLLRNNYLSDLPNDIRDFSSLEELQLDGNRFAALPMVVVHELPTITFLNVSNNPLRSFQGLEMMPALRTLVISMCDLRMLPLPVKSCSNLTSLDVSFNEGIAFPNDFAASAAGKKLTTISVANCGLRGHELPSAIRSLSALTSIDISDNNFDLFHSAGFFSGLRVVTLKLRRMQLREIPPSVLSLKSLEELDLSENALTNVDMIWTIQKLQILSLSHCELTTLPDEFALLSGSLRELDISHNPKFCSTSVVSKLQSLERLSIVGCLFCGNTDGRDTEWADVAKLKSLRRIDWSDWSQGKSFNPYSTKLPVHLCGMSLTNVNGLRLRPGLFTYDFVATLSSLLRDGFFKVDFLFEVGALWHYLGVLKLLKPLGREYFSEDCAGPDRFRSRVMLSVCRYLFFLAFQSHNFDTPIIPPLDVVALHYSQMTVAPLTYRQDCMRIAGKLMDCNYRMVVCEGSSVEENMQVHRMTWNMVVDWQSKSTGRPLEWLKYDYCSQNAGADQGTNPFSVKSAKSLPENANVRTSEFHLDRLLPNDVAEYFRHCDLTPYQRALSEFFHTGEGFIRNEDHFESQGMELWARYARFVALYAQEKRLLSTDLACGKDEHHLLIVSAQGSRSSSLSSKPGCGPQGGHRRAAHEGDDFVPLIPKQANECTSSSCSTPLGLPHVVAVATAAATPFAVVPTLGMRLMLCLHRSAPIKYAQCLEYLNIPSATDDIMWSQTREDIERTTELWSAAYHETYLRQSSNQTDSSGSSRSLDVEYNSSAVKRNTPREQHGTVVVPSSKKVSIMSFDRQDV